MTTEAHIIITRADVKILAAYLKGMGYTKAQVDDAIARPWNWQAELVLARVAWNEGVS